MGWSNPLWREHTPQRSPRAQSKNDIKSKIFVFFVLFVVKYKSRPGVDQLNIEQQNKEPQNRKNMYDHFDIPCSIFCGSQRVSQSGGCSYRTRFM